MRITCVYAYKPEVLHLQKRIEKTAWSAEVSWFNWVGVNKKSDVNDFSDSDIIVNAGFAGSLKDHLPLEKVFHVDQLIDPVSKKAVNLTSARNILDSASCLSDDNYSLKIRLLTVSRPVVEETEKNNLLDKFNADIVDLEAWNIFQLSKKSGIPFISFKLISDYANERSTAAVIANKNKLGHILGEALFGIFETLTRESNGNIRNHTGI